MGLDQYVYEIHKPKYDPSAVFDRNEIDGILIPMDEIDEPYVCELRPYCQLLTVNDRITDFDAIKRAFGVPQDEWISQIDHRGIWFGDYSDVVSHEFGDLSQKELDAKRIFVPQEAVEKFTKTVTRKYFVTQETYQERYWRKRYDIQDWFHEHLGREVENTGYYRLDEDIIEAFNEAFPNEYLEKPDAGGDLYYWEWY